MGYSSFLVVDSDSDNFKSLKNVSKPKQNGTAKPTKSDAEGARPGAKVGMKSPIRPSSTQSKTAVKSPVTPKSAGPPQPKQTPTSVFDYFGSAAIQRSDKKLVASTKRKAVSIDGLSPVFTSSLQTLPQSYHALVFHPNRQRSWLSPTEPTLFFSLITVSNKDPFTAH